MVRRSLRRRHTSLSVERGVSAVSAGQRHFVRWQLGGHMEPVPSEARTDQREKLRAFMLAILAVCIFINSLDRLFDAWAAGRTSRIAMNAAVSLVAIAAAVHFAVRVRTG